MTALTNDQVDKMTKAELAKACKAHGTKAGKLCLVQQREELKKAKDLEGRSLGQLPQPRVLWITIHCTPTGHVCSDLNQLLSDKPLYALTCLICKACRRLIASGQSIRSRPATAVSWHEGPTQ